MRSRSATTTPTEAQRKAAFTRIAAGVAAGLPVPEGITTSANHRFVSLRIAQGDMQGMRAWASFLGLPNPTATKPVKIVGRMTTLFTTDFHDVAGVPGLRFEILGSLNADAEVTE